MPLNVTDEIAYVPDKGGIHCQNNPPVCNLCKQEMTRENFGWMYFEGEGRGRTRGKFEFIACRGCTRMRAGGTPLRLFVQRHTL
jgi:hypothetical protein